MLLVPLQVCIFVFVGSGHDFCHVLWGIALLPLRHSAMVSSLPSFHFGWAGTNAGTNINRRKVVRILVVLKGRRIREVGLSTITVKTRLKT